MIGNAASTLLAGTLPLEVFGCHVSSLTSATLAENQPIIVYQFRDLCVWCFQSEEEVKVAGVWWTCMVPVTWYLAFPCCAPCFILTPLPTPTHLLNVNPDLPSL